MLARGEDQFPSISRIGPCHARRILILARAVLNEAQKQEQNFEAFSTRLLPLVILHTFVSLFPFDGPIFLSSGLFILFSTYRSLLSLTVLPTYLSKYLEHFRLLDEDHVDMIEYVLRSIMRLSIRWWTSK